MKKLFAIVLLSFSFCLSSCGESFPEKGMNTIKKHINEKAKEYDLKASYSYFSYAYVTDDGTIQAEFMKGACFYKFSWGIYNSTAYESFLSYGIYDTEGLCAYASEGDDFEMWKYYYELATVYIHEGYFKGKLGTFR